MKLATCMTLIGGLLAAASATADVIHDWNENVVTAGYTARQGPPPHTRIVAMVHLAMFEAVNSIDARYRPYRARLAAEPGASREAAAAAAAHYLLVRIYPDQAKEMDKALQASLADVTDETARINGTRLGERAGAAMLAERSNDGAAGPDTYRPFTAPGKYVPTVLPAASRWGSVRPFALKSADQYRPPAPYALTGAEWAKDYDEVKRMGAKSGSARSAEQTDVARFWELTGAATYNPLVRHLSAARRLDVTDNARLFALVSMAAADALMSVFDAKYAYNFWRPVTAIRNGDLSGNDAIERDAAWEPFIPTPMHPEYPCAHCITQSAAARVLESFFGNAIPPVKLTSTTAPGVSRSFVKLSDYVDEVINARVYDGVHYRASGNVGAEMGRKIADYTLQNHLLPVR
jgi:PAP2 superfamily protein